MRCDDEPTADGIAPPGFALHVFNSARALNGVTLNTPRFVQSSAGVDSLPLWCLAADVLRLQDIRVRATYRNSNPVEVLKAHHAIASEHSASPSPICFRGDTEYMQPHKEDSGGNGTAHCHSNLGTLLGVPEKLSCDLHTTGAQQHIAPTEKSTGEASANSERNEKGKLSAPARRVMSL
eukprot:TRINITY_DN10316_c0_g1_i4.p1 TRINITY_DN10316_c0_g1~~TRINITY_DN10316_c0_g1_i4.p1  ORF type:complete len:179 (-),score=14.52 TRINITY_DN10316_c0_g1_i4:344-880(-)